MCFRLHLCAGLTKTVGLEMAQQGNITCNAICPGYVLTDLIKNQLKDTAKARGIPEVNACSATGQLGALQALTISCGKYSSALSAGPAAWLCRGSSHKQSSPEQDQTGHSMPAMPDRLAWLRPSCLPLSCTER